MAGGLLSASSAPLQPGTWLLTQISVVPFEYFRKMLFPFNMNIDIDNKVPITFLLLEPYRVQNSSLNLKNDDMLPLKFNNIINLGP